MPSSRPRTFSLVPALLVLLLALACSAAAVSPALAATGYAANTSRGTVTPFNTETLVAGTAISVGTNPNQIAVTPDGKTAYVTNGGSASVTPIDVSTGTPGTPIPVPATPNGIVISPGGKTAYVVSEGSSPSFQGTVTPINLATNTAGTPINTAKGATMAAITPDGAKLYVSNTAAKSISVISTATNTVTATIAVGKEPRGIAVTPDGKTAWVAIYGANQATPITVATNATGTSIATGTKPMGVATSPDGRYVFVASSESYALTRIPVAAPNTPTSVSMGGQVQWVTFSEDGSVAYLTDPSGGVRAYAESGVGGGFISLARTIGGVAIAPEVVPAGTPSAPGELATIPGDGEVQLSWAAPASSGEGPVDHYVVVPRVGSTDQAPIVTPDASTSLTVPGLTNGQTYSFRVAAVNAAGRGRYSYRIFKRLPTVATAPTGLEAAEGDNQAQLKWAAPSDDGGAAIDHYRIVVTHNGEQAPAIEPTGASTSYTVTGLTNGENYSFTLAAVNAKGVGASTAPVSLHLATPPDAPSDLLAATADGQARLSWIKPSYDGGRPLIGYEITTTGPGGTVTKLVNPTTHTVIGGLTNGETYSFTVAAITSRFTGAATAALEVPLPATPVRPAWQVTPPLTALAVGFGTINGASRPTITPAEVSGGAVGSHVALSANPGIAHGIVLAPGGTTAWVDVEENGGAGFVVPVELAKMKVGTPVAVGKAPAGIAITPDGSTVYVVNNGAGSVTPVDTATMKAGPAIPVGSSPNGIAITPDGKTAWVVTTGSASVTPIDLATGTTGEPVTAGNEPKSIAIDPAGTKAYVANYRGGTVSVIDLATATVTKTIRVGGFANDIAFTPDGKTAYAVDLGPDLITTIDAAGDSSGSSFSVDVGHNPNHIAFSPDGATAWVGDESGGGSPVDLVTGTVGPRTDMEFGSSYGVALTSTEVLGMPTAPTIQPLEGQLAGDVKDPANPTLGVKVSQNEVEPSELEVSVVSSSDEAVAPLGGISVGGTGAIRTVTVTPGGKAPATSTITLKVTGPDSQSSTVTFEYGLTNAAPDTSTRWLTGASDESTAQDVGGGYMIVGNDENNSLRLYKRGVSGPPIKSWNYSAQLRVEEEVDIEASTRVGDTIYWTGSHGNSKKGKNRPPRQIVFATKVTGEGAATELTFEGSYHDLKGDLIRWDEANENPLHLAEASGGVPKRIGGFNIEGLVMAPHSTTTAYFGFRAPLEPAEEGGKALVVPVTNFNDLFTPEGIDTDEEGNRTLEAHFGEPILMDLGGLSIREMKKNANDEYLIIAGSYLAGGEYALYKWDGVPADPPVRTLTKLPAAEDAFGEDPGAWESIVNMPEHLESGEDLELVMDNGSTDFFNTGQEAKELPVPLEKSRTDHFTLLLREAPKNTSAPSLSGDPKVASQLTCGEGGWSGAPTPTLTYGWLEDGTPIAGADGSTYTVKVPDAGHAIGCVVTASNEDGEASAPSPTVTIEAAPIGCRGASVSGAGSSLQLSAHHDLWSPAFAAHCPGGPAVDYEAGGSGPALAGWGFGGGAFDQAQAFIGTDEAPTAAQIKASDAASGTHALVIPVAQTAIAVVVNPPAGCEIGELTNKQLESIMRGNIRIWNKVQTASGAGCVDAPITRVVRAEGSGLTHQLKDYLAQVSEASLPCTEGAATWRQLEGIGTTGAPDTLWPENGVAGCPAGQLSPLTRAAGDAGVVGTVDATEGAIGYAALPAVEAGRSGDTHWLKLQNNGVSNKLGIAHMARPVDEPSGQARCASATYTVPKAARSTRTEPADADWSQVTGSSPNLGGATGDPEAYPLCTLTYDIALTRYSAAGFTEGQERTVAAYLAGLVTAAEGQDALEEGARFYAPLPATAIPASDVLGAARLAAGRIGF